VTSEEVLAAVDELMERQEYRLTPALYPLSGDPVEPVRDRSYTAYFTAFEGRQMADCVEHVETLVVETWLVSPERLTQPAYRETMLPERDKVLDALLSLQVASSRITGRSEPLPDGLTLRTRFEVPITFERPHGS